MKPQHFESKNEKIRHQFAALKKAHPERLTKRLQLSWSNWGFGVEDLRDSAQRLQRAGIRFIELHGNHYGPALGYKPKETLQLVGDHGIAVAGVCGMFSPDNDLSSARAIHRQAALDYVQRELEFGAAVGAGYLLVVPGAVGRPQPYDDMEFHRSVETLHMAGDLFVSYGLKAAIEPIRSAEVSLVHTIAEAKRYIAAVNHPGVRHINGDVYHMQSEESHIGEALLEAGAMLTNLHLADSNRSALGKGSMDLDVILMALYLLNYNVQDKFVTPEPLGPGGNPYPAMYGKPDKALLDQLVGETADYLREREESILNGT
jgi:D-psicose/D-tagatose/L-ribulose 3-epimerase